MVNNSKAMKKLQLVCAACCILIAAASFSQTTRLKDLNRFNKIVLDKKVSTVDVARSHDDVSILIEGAKEENVSASIEAGVLYLKVDVNDALVHVFNSELKRIEGDNALEVSGAEVIGRNGKFLITDFDDRSHRSFTYRGGDRFDFNFDHDFDIDLDLDLDELDDLDLNVSVDIDDHDWNWNWEWEWDWNWADHRHEFRSHSKDFKRDLKNSINDIKEDLKDDLKDLKRELKRIN